MNDLEDRLRATYAAVAEQTAVAELRETDEHVVVPLTATRHRVPLRRVGLSVAAAVVLLAGLVAVTRGRHTAPADDSGDGRPFAIPMYVPTGFALIDATVEDSVVPLFPSTRTTVAALTYEGANGTTIGVSSAAAIAPPIPADRSVVLAAGWIATASVDANATTLAWVRPNGAAVSIVASGVSLDELTAMADSIWYATPDGFETATGTAGFGEHVFESWQPPGDRFSGSRVRIAGTLQAVPFSHVHISWFDGAFGTVEPYAECRGMQLDDSGRIELFGPATVQTFVVTLPDGSLRRQEAASPAWYPSAAFASIKVDKPPAAYHTNPVPVTCEEAP